MFSRVKNLHTAKITSEAFWVVLGQALAATGGIAAVRVLTELMSPSTYGQLALVMTGVMLLQQTAFAGPGASALRFYAAALERDEFAGFISALRRLTFRRLVASAAISALIMLLVWILAGRVWITIAFFAFLLAVFNSLPAVLDGIQNAARQRAVVAWHQCLAMWLKFMMAGLFIVAFGESLLAAVCGYTLASAFVFMSQLVFFQMKFGSMVKAGWNDIFKNNTESDAWLERLASYGFPFTLWGIPNWLQLSSDRWALERFTNSSEVGHYAILYQLGFYPISILSTLLLQLTTPLIYARAGEGADLNRMRSARRLNFLIFTLTLAATGLLTLFTYFIHPWLFSVLVAAEYRQTSFLLPLVVLGAGLFASAQVATMALMSGKETTSLLAPKIICSLIGVALNIAGAYYRGILGVVLATVAFSLIYLGWILMLTRQLPLTDASARHSG